MSGLPLGLGFAILKRTGRKHSSPSSNINPKFVQDVNALIRYVASFNLLF